MTQHVNLTNEKLIKLFDNPFDLVNHAIHLARQVIESGHEFGDGADRNSASQILKRILKDKQQEKQGQEFLEMEKSEQPHSHDHRPL